jgi:hypothetical protein
MIFMYLLESDTGKKEKSHEPEVRTISLIIMIGAMSFIYQIAAHAHCETLDRPVIAKARADKAVNDLKLVDS